MVISVDRDLMALFDETSIKQSNYPKRDKKQPALSLIPSGHPDYNN